MMTALGVLFALSSIGNARWAAEGGHRKTADACAVSSALGAVIGAYLLFVGLS